MATEEETKQAGLLAHIMAYFKKEEPKAEAEDEKPKEDEEEKAESEDEDVEVEEEKESEKAKAEGDDSEKEEEAKAEGDEDEEDMKATIKALQEKLAAAEAKAQSDEDVKAELGKAGVILDAMSDNKVTMHEAKNLFSKSASEVSAALKEVESNATGRGKTEEPKEDAKCSVYEEYQSLEGNDKSAFFASNRDEIIKQMNTEK